MRTVLIIVLYFFIVCSCNRELTNFRSLLEVQLNPTLYQVLFLPRHIGHGISLIVIISQLLLYIMISIFIFTLIFHDMLIPYAKSINQVYTHIFLRERRQFSVVAHVYLLFHRQPADENHRRRNCRVHL